MSKTTPLDGTSARPQHQHEDSSPAKPHPSPEDLRHAAARFGALLGRGSGNAGSSLPAGDARLSANDPHGGPQGYGAADAGIAGHGTSATGAHADAEHLLSFLEGGRGHEASPGAAKLPAADGHDTAAGDGLSPAGEPGSERLERRKDEGKRDGEGSGSDGEQAFQPGIQPLQAEPAAPRPSDAVPEPVAVRGSGIAELVDRLAERVLVGQRADGTAEIRLTLRGDVMGGTEVRIARVEQGLELHIDAASEAALRTLRERGDDLVQGLSDRLGGAVSLQVTSSLRQDGSGDPNRRSSGYDDILTYMADRR